MIASIASIVMSLTMFRRKIGGTGFAGRAVASDSCELVSS